MKCVSLQFRENVDTLKCKNKWAIKFVLKFQMRKELQHESCYYLPLRNGVAFPFFLAPAFRNQVLSCN